MRRLLPVLGVLVALSATPSALADEFVTAPACALPTDVHCVADVTVDGLPAPASVAVEAELVRVSATAPFSWGRWNVLDPTRTTCTEFSAADQFNCPANLPGLGLVAFTLRLGALDPVTVRVTGTNVQVERGRDATGNTLRVAARPAPMAVRAAGCVPGDCGPDTRPADWGFDGRLTGAVFSHDGADADVRDTYRGLWETFNVQSSTFLLDEVTRELVVSLANPHLDPAGRPFVGTYEAFLPANLLRRLFLVPDPTLVRTSSVTVTRTDGSTTVPATATVTTSPLGVQVRLSGITFSSPVLRIRARSAPGQPRAVAARRTSSTTGTLAFRRPLLSGGALVSGYRARCTGGGRTVSGRGASSPIAVGGLRDRVTYSCTLRAVNLVGAGRPVTTVLPG